VGSPLVPPASSEELAAGEHRPAEPIPCFGSLTRGAAGPSCSDRGKPRVHSTGCTQRLHALVFRFKEMGFEKWFKNLIQMLSKCIYQVVLLQNV